jgi:hypothetical protein
MDREPLNRFFHRRTRAAVHPDQSSACCKGVLLHAALIDSVRMPNYEGSVRRPSMCHDGTPVVYSVKLSSQQERSPYRILVEPGDFGVPVSEQIDYSLAVADRILHMLSWQSAVDQINNVLSSLIPLNSATVDAWWGGLWLGATIPEEHLSGNPELRIYVNLRCGDASSRWSRVAESLGRLAISGSAEPLERWLNTTSLRAVPVGLAMAVDGPRLRGLRIYVVISAHAMPELVRLSACFSETQFEKLVEFNRTFEEHFRMPDTRTVTVGYDFIHTDDGIHPSIARIKTDLCCQLLEDGCKSDVLPWLGNQLDKLEITRSGLDDFVDDLHAEWSRFDVEFAGIGVSAQETHVTVYVKPDLASGTKIDRCC